MMVMAATKWFFFDQQEENDGITENLQNRLINIEEEDKHWYK
jgi:hypothetical protein